MCTQAFQIFGLQLATGDPAKHPVSACMNLLHDVLS